MSATDNEHPSARTPSSGDDQGAHGVAAASQPGNSGGVPRPSPPRPAGRGIVAGLPPPPPLEVQEAETMPPAPPPLRQKTPRMPQISEPDFEPTPISQPPAMREPEASMEIPPPAELEPYDARPPGAKDPYIGTTFDHRYKIERLLGEGGMGFVYLARHKVIDKRVAVKVLRAELAKDREIFERFVQEARAASSIGNPHIVDISDFGDLPDGSTYFVMEYLEGTSLSAIIDGGDTIPIDRICHISMQMAAGLAAAHDAGIVHRDLKPDNVFVVSRGGDPDFVKILDFGIAKVSTSATTKLTRAGAVFGTPHYMSPEQAAGAPIDHRTDIYSLGVMMYELVSRQLPFNADNFMGILTQHMYKAPVPIRALVGGPDCPPGLEAVILKCLSKKPDARYQTMNDLRSDLATVRAGNVPGAVAEMMARSGGFNVPHDFFKPKVIMPATPPAPQRQPWPRYVWIAGAAAAVGLVLAIIVVGGPTTANNGAGLAPTAAPPPPVAAPAAAPEVKKVSVALAAIPETAMAYRDGAAQRLPMTVDVEDGRTVSVEIRAEGYVTQTIVLDGKEPSKMVKLVADEKAAKPPTIKATTGRPVAPSSTKKQGSGDIRDPWAK